MSVWLKGSLVNRINTSLLQSLFHRTMATGNSETTNRLGQEKSPYLLQHATNPVDWYPWGQEAFDAAKTQNKLIFLSVGYSTCHWCHVMERESFENQEIAKIMNEHFINVKVDREERPDVDKVYMTFVTASSGRGGWPMSVFLTPNLEPIAGGTYFPPSDMYGRPGFTSILNSIGSKWRSDKSKLIESGCKIMEVLKKNSKLDGKSSDSPTEEVFARAFVQLSRMYEPEYGGFGDAPKFPQPSNLNFLFAYKALYPLLDDAKTGVDMCLHTLKMMSKGGIHDHIAQGFARYSTDKKWHVPHFEKMLYDQAQLVMAYLDAFLLTKDNSHVDVVRDILAYVNRDLSHPSGGFYSAEDADSFPNFSCKEKREGAFCVWKYHTIKTLLSSPIEEGNTESPLMYQIFNFHYSVMENGNIDPYQDPHDEMKNQNVLIVHGSVAETAEEFGISEEKCQLVLSKCRGILYEERKKRPRPHLDDKMLTAWNGMMLSAYARAGAILKDESYIERALQNVKFIQDHLYKNDILYRSAYKCPDGDGITLGSEIEGFSDDYAWVIRGLIQLYNATANQNWLLWAEKLQDKQNDLFWDQKSAGFFLSSPGDSFILLNLKDDHDGAEPSVNSVSCWNLINLSRLLNRSDFEMKISSIFKLFCDRLMKVPASLPEMSVSLLMYLNPAEQIILSGDEGSASFKAMLDTVNSSTFNPNRIILVAGTEPNSLLYSRVEHLKKYIPKFGQDCGGAVQDSGKIGKASVSARQDSGKVGQDYVEVGQDSVGSCQDSVDVGQGITPGRQDTVVYLCKDFACSLPVKSASCLRAKMASQAAL